MDGIPHKQKHFDDFVLQKELSLSPSPTTCHVVSHTQPARVHERERERERERDRPLRDDYAFTRGLYFNGFGASPPILSILCASYSS